MGFLAAIKCNPAAFANVSEAFFRRGIERFYKLSVEFQGALGGSKDSSRFIAFRNISGGSVGLRGFTGSQVSSWVS